MQKAKKQGIKKGIPNINKSGRNPKGEWLRGEFLEKYERSKKKYILRVIIKKLQ